MIFPILKHVTNSVSSRMEFNKEIEKNLKVKTKAGHYVQSEGERIIADRLYAAKIPQILFFCKLLLRYFLALKTILH